MKFTSQISRFSSYSNGETPYVKNGNWWIGDTDTGVAAQAMDGVSFSGVDEYYYATLATDLDTDGIPQAPVWNKNAWFTKIQDSKFATKNTDGVTYKYLWNVEVVKSISAEGKITESPSEVELFLTQMDARVPEQYISYYAASNTSVAPQGYPTLGENNNFISGPGNPVWKTEDDYTGSADESAFLFEVSFIKYTETDENGKNLYAAISGPTMIGHNGANGLNGDDAVSYSLAVIPNSWNKTKYPTISPSFVVTQYIGSSITHMDSGYVIKVGETIWENESVSSETTFDLYVNGVLVDSETITPISDGADGKTPKKGVDYFDGSNGKDGTSIVWKGEFDEAPANPENGWAYYNKKAKASYTYNNGSWYQMSIDGINGQNGADGLPIVWKGELESAPEPAELNWVYKDTNDGVVFIYGEAGWEPMVLDGNDGEDGAPGTDGLSVFVTYNDSTSEPSKPTGAGNSDGWHTTATNSAIWMSQKVAASATEGEWGSPIKIKGDKGEDAAFFRITASSYVLVLKKDEDVLEGITLKIEKANIFDEGEIVWEQYDDSEGRWQNMNEGGQEQITILRAGRYRASISGTVWTDEVFIGTVTDGDDSYSLVVSNPLLAFVADENGVVSQSDGVASIYVNLYKGTELQEINIRAPWSDYYPDIPVDFAIYGQDSIEPEYVVWLTEPWDFGSESSCTDSFVIEVTSTDGQYSGEVVINWTKTNTGRPGVGISQVINYYVISNKQSGVTINNTVGWTVEVQTATSAKPYLWNYEEITYSDGDKKNSIPAVIGMYAEDGRSITSVAEFYAISDTKETAPTNWSLDIPTLTATQKYLWNKERITFSDNNYVDSDPIIIGVYGDKGDKGDKGDDGASPYLVVLSNDNATIGTNANGGGYSAALLQNITTTNVTVFEGANNITNDCSFAWTVTNGTLNNTNSSLVYFTALNADSATAKVTVKKGSTTIGTKDFTVSKVKQGQAGANGDDAVTYALSVAPNSWNLTKSSSLKPTIKIIKYVGSTITTQTIHAEPEGWTSPYPATGTKMYEYGWADFQEANTYTNKYAVNDLVLRNGVYYKIKAVGKAGIYSDDIVTVDYVIKANGAVWSGTAITETTTFELWVDGNHTDSETVNAVQDGEQGPQGEKGENAQDFNISASSYMLSADSAGNIKTGSKVTLTAHAMNLDASKIQWSTNNSTWTNTGSSTYEVTATGTYYARVNGTNFKDSVTIGKTIDGTDGTNGIDAISINLTNPTMTFNNSASGESEVCQVVVYEGATKLSSGSGNSKFSVAKSSNQATVSGVSISGDTITVSDQTSGGSYTVTVTVKNKEGTQSSQDFTIYWTAVTSPYSMDLTNDSAVIVTDKDGNNGGYGDNAKTTATVYHGSAEDSGWTYTVSPASSSSLTYTLSNSNRTIAVTNMTADSGQLTISAAKIGYPTQTKVFKISKLKQGDDGTPGTNGTNGTSATSYWLTSSLNTIAMDQNGGYKDTTLTFTAKKQTGAGTPTTYTTKLVAYKDNSSTALSTSTNGTLSITLSSTAPTKNIHCMMYYGTAGSSILDEEKILVVKDGEDGDNGIRGTGTLPITTVPSAYTTTVNGITPAYRIALSTVKSQSQATEVLVGDILESSYYHYPVVYVSSDYVYCGAKRSIQGDPGPQGNPAQDLNLVASSYALFKESADATSYKNSVTLTAKLKNIDQKVQWKKGSGSWGTATTSLTMAVTSPDTYYVRTADGVWEDYIIISEVVDGEDGEDGVSAISIVLTNPSMTFNNSVTGESEVCEVVVYEGGSKLSYGTGNSQFTVAKASTQTTNSAVTVSSNKITVSDQTAKGSYTVTVTVKNSKGTSTSQNYTIYWNVVTNGTNGSPGSNGTNGDTISTVYAYCLSTLTSLTTKPSGTPTSSGTNTGVWYLTEPAESSMSSSKPYLYRSEGTKTVSGVTGTTSYAGWQNAVLVKAWNNVSVPYDNYAEYLRVTNFGTDGLYYSGGKLLINASHIKVTSRKDGSSGDVVFEAASSSDTVTLAGWIVDNNSIRVNSLGASGSMWLCRGGTSTSANIGNSGTMSGWSIAVGGSFGVTSAGALYASSLYASGGTIAGWTISSQYGVHANYEVAMVNPSTAASGLKRTSPIDSTDKAMVFYAHTEDPDGDEDYPNFCVLADGAMYASYGQIGNWKLSTNGLSYGAGIGYSSSFMLTPGGTYYSAAIGGSSTGLTWAMTVGSVFGVTTAGHLYASAGQIGASETSGVLKINTTATIMGDSSTSSITSTYFLRGPVGNTGVNLSGIGYGLANSYFYLGPGGLIMRNSNYTLNGGASTSSYRGFRLSPTCLIIEGNNRSPEYSNYALRLYGGGFTYSLLQTSSNSQATGSEAQCVGKSKLFGSSGVNYGEVGELVVVHTDYNTSNSTEDHGYGFQFQGSRYLRIRTYWGDGTINGGGRIRFDTAYLYSEYSLKVDSDRRLKANISHLNDDQLEIFYDGLIPSKFTLKSQGQSGGYHAGFIAQEVEAALLAADLPREYFAGLSIPIGNKDTYSISYEEFVALNTWQIQKLKPRMTAAEQEIEKLKLEITQLREEIKNLQNS